MYNKKILWEEKNGVSLTRVREFSAKLFWNNQEGWYAQFYKNDNLIEDSKKIQSADLHNLSKDDFAEARARVAKRIRQLQSIKLAAYV